MRVTARAAQELKHILEAHATEAEQILRLAPEPGGQLILTLDQAREGDEVVESEGSKVLAVGENIAWALESVVLDCVDTPQGPQLTLSREVEETEEEVEGA
jgi:Fe-S cluster assembly iron-binding protein IscA